VRSECGGHDSSCSGASTIKKKSTSLAQTVKIVVSGVMRCAARHGAVMVNPVREVGWIDSTPTWQPRALTADERRSGWTRG
jgi:hypothetical protein